MYAHKSLFPPEDEPGSTTVLSPGMLILECVGQGNVSLTGTGLQHNRKQHATECRCA